jgi:hypothetical protein
VSVAQAVTGTVAASDALARARFGADEMERRHNEENLGTERKRQVNNF